jgi:hypothetical protein
MICQQVTLSGDAEWPKVADAVIEAGKGMNKQNAGAPNDDNSILDDQVFYS